MVTRHCDTCRDEGRIRWMIEMDPHCYMEPDSEGMIPCPDCGRDLGDCERSRPSPVRLLREAARVRILRARSLWAGRNCDTITAEVTAHRGVLADQPRLRSLIERDLHRRLAEAPTPLGWRRDDLRWSLTNAWRSARGRMPLPPPHEAIVEVEMIEADADLFERGLVRIVARCRRRPVRRA